MNLRLPILLAAAVLVGCAARPTSTQKAGAPGQPLAATRPLDAKANLTLDQIPPAVTLPTPSTQPSDRPSLDAISLYAKAVDEQLQNRRFEAITDFEKAVTLDPTSAELRQSLGRAYLGTGAYSDASISALEKSAAIQPDDLDVQLQLGRQYLAKNDLPNAMLAFRHAMLTTEYGYGDDQAALTDFFLASTLQRSGYDRAALDRYQVLLERIKSPGPNLRENPELNYLISRPDAIWIEMAGLFERDGRYDDALAAYEAAAERDPDNFELQSHIVRTLTSLHRPEAKTRATQLVKDQYARADTVTLLRDTYRGFGNELGAADVLRQMYTKDPTDRGVLYALTGTLQQLGKTTEARDLLVSAARTNHYPVEIVSRLQRLYEVTGEWQKTTALLIEASQQRPDLVGRYAPLWSRLIRPAARRRVRIEDVKSFDVPKDQQAAKWFWVSTLADASNRDGLAKTSLDQALAVSPAYVPAYRMTLNNALQDDANAEADIKALLDRSASGPALSAELHGIVLLSQKKAAEAETTFRRAIELGAKSPDLQDELVDALIRQNKDNDAEQTLLGIVKDWPDYEPAYLQLVGFYASRNHDNLTIKTLDTWVANDPTSTTARLLQARFLLESRRPDAAEAILNQLLDEESDNGEVLSQIQQLYTQQGRLDLLADKLTMIYAKQPENLELLTHLVAVQLGNHNPNEASRLVDAGRITFAANADALYVLSGLYRQLDQKQQSEDTLAAALLADPKNASVNNDLGYNWVDSGKNINKAEAMIRQAVATEPDNQAFLDSLGWVLYKRSRFDEAVKYLEQASEGNRPDPIVLDHLGDALYRANRKTDAQATWQKASDRLAKLDTSRDDLKELRLQLNAKLGQAKGGGPVTVAPVIELPAAHEQAKGN